MKPMTTWLPKLIKVEDVFGNVYYIDETNRMTSANGMPFALSNSFGNIPLLTRALMVAKTDEARLLAARAYAKQRNQVTLVNDDDLAQTATHGA